MATRLKPADATGADQSATELKADMRANSQSGPIAEGLANAATGTDTGTNPKLEALASGIKDAVDKSKSMVTGGHGAEAPGTQSVGAKAAPSQTIRTP